MEQKKSSNQVVSILYTLGKELFLNLLFLRIFETLLFRQSKKVSSIPCLLESSLHFWRREDQIDAVYVKKKEKKSFPYVDIKSVVPKYKFVLKNSSIVCWFCFRLI